MGEAKRRGTREQRVAEAVERDRLRSIEVQKLLDAKEAAMTPEEKRARDILRTRLASAQMMARNRW